MNKAKTAKVLSAVALANMAALGFAASPASAAAHLAPGTAGGGVATAAPSAGRSHPGTTFTPSGKWRIVNSPGQLRQASPAAGAAVKAAAAATKASGFVPRSSPRAVPDTETGCTPSGVVCLGLYGGANFVSYVNTSWTTGTRCHIGHITYATPYGSGYSYSSSGYTCRNHEFSVPV